MTQPTHWAPLPEGPKKMTENEENAYVQGQAMMASQLLDFAAKFLPANNVTETRATAINERARVALIAIGRDVFGEEWESDLHLEDMIEKRLRPALEQDE